MNGASRRGAVERLGPPSLRSAATIRREAYDRLWVQQGGRCAICGKQQRARALALDHDHQTGRIRGLLCMRCNRALGAYEYDVLVLGAAIAYFEQILQDRGLKV